MTLVFIELVVVENSSFGYIYIYRIEYVCVCVTPLILERLQNISIIFIISAHIRISKILIFFLLLLLLFTTGTTWE